MTMTKKEIQAQEIEKATTELKQMLEKANYRVYTSLLHVSASGMTRRISAYVAQEFGQIVNIDWYIEKLGLFKRDAKGGLKVTGCGMDMGFDVVYQLSNKLFRNEDGSYSHDGAYKLKQEWM